jgi:hypothetical protein
MLSPNRVRLGPGLTQSTVAPVLWSCFAKSMEKMIFSSGRSRRTADGRCQGRADESDLLQQADGPSTFVRKYGIIRMTSSETPINTAVR